MSTKIKWKQLPVNCKECGVAMIMEYIGKVAPHNSQIICNGCYNENME